VVIAGGGPTGLMLAGELALAGIDVAIVERRASQDLAGARAGGLHARAIEVLDQRGIADRFLAQGQLHRVVHFHVPLDISDAPTRHNYVLGLWQHHIERILAEWVGELAVTIHRGREVTGFAQDDSGVDVALSDGQSLRAQYLVGCDGGRSLVRKAAGIAFPGWDPTTSWLIAEAETAEEPKWGLHQDAHGIHGIGKVENGGSVRIVLTEPQLRTDSEPTLRDVSAALTAVYGNTDGFELRGRLPQVATVELDGFEIVVTHGDQFGSPTPELVQGAFPTAEIIVYGHTHRPLLTLVDTVVTVMNPGGAGHRRFNLPPSVGILELEPGIPPRGRLVPLLPFDPA